MAGDNKMCPQVTIWQIHCKKIFCDLGQKCLDVSTATPCLNPAFRNELYVKLARPTKTWEMVEFSSDYFDMDVSSASFLLLCWVSLESQTNLPQPFIGNLKEKSTQTSSSAFGQVLGHNDLSCLVYLYASWWILVAGAATYFNFNYCYFF